MQVSVSDDEEFGGDLVELAYQYVTNGTYPEGCSDGKKRSVRWKAKKFEVIGGELFYKHKINGRVSQNKHNQIIYHYCNHMQGEVLLRYIQDADQRKKILHACHVKKTAGHLGRTRTLHWIKERFMWHGMVKDFTEIVC